MREVYVLMKLFETLQIEELVEFFHIRGAMSVLFFLFMDVHGYSNIDFC